MRARLLFTIVFLATLVVTGAHSAAQNAGVDADAAKVFLASVYKHYGTGGIGVDTVGPDASLYFHSSLLALLRADEKAASPEVGAIDGDPVCACQDWNGIWGFAVDVKMETPERATANVSFSLSDPKESAKDGLRKLAITLGVENGGWRIYDIVDETDPSAPFALRKALQDDIAAHSRPK
jgi:hypothetical protein